MYKFHSNIKYSQLTKFIHKRCYQTSETGVYGYRPPKQKSQFEGKNGEIDTQKMSRIMYL